MKFSFQRLLYNLCTMFLPYLAVAILSVAVTENRHPAFWYLHAASNRRTPLTSFQRVKERK